MSGEYAKGPWRHYRPETAFHEGYGYIESGDGIYENGNIWISGFMSDANARLIAAAPELLGALESLVTAMRDYEIDVDGTPPLEHREMMKQARSAIKKAKGET